MAVPRFSITITGHGLTFSGHIFLNGDPSTPNEGFKYFLAALGNAMCEENTGMELRSCKDAETDEDRIRMREIAKAFGGNVKGWSDDYAIRPYGDEWTAYPSGEVKKTQISPNGSYKNSWLYYFRNKD